jgi:hypothetical protein
VLAGEPHLILVGACQGAARFRVNPWDTSGKKCRFYDTVERKTKGKPGFLARYLVKLLCVFISCDESLPDAP